MTATPQLTVPARISEALEAPIHELRKADGCTMVILKVRGG